MSDAKLASMIDHTLLKPDATREHVEKLCCEAAEHGFASVCVNPSWVPLCRELLAGSKVKVCTVIGFPLGSTSTGAKAAEAGAAARDGAEELDMVIHVGKLLDGDSDYVEADIRAVVEAARGRPVKVILEICLLDEAHILAGCKLAVAAGAKFVKTSTGFSTGGATVEAVRLMRRAVGPDIGVKASGGIRTRKEALAMIEAGASRIGASASVALVEGS